MNNSPLEPIDPLARPVPGFRGYFASSDGRIWSTRMNPDFSDGFARRMKPNPVGKEGRPAVMIRRDDKTVANMKVHRLVLLTWLGPPPEGKPHGCHNDGNFRNCNIDNLRWDNARGNSDDARNHGTMVVGSAHPGAKLTEKTVVAIRARHLQGESIRSLASECGVTELTAWKAITRRTWKHT